MRHLLLILGLGLLLAGCGGAGGESSPAGNEASAGPAGAVEAEPADPAGMQEPVADAGEDAAGDEPAPSDSDAEHAAREEPTAPSPEPTPPEEAASDEPSADAVTVWVTRDAGAELVREGQVDAGRTAIQAVATLAEVETRYGGRYVDAIDGISSDFDGQNDWFFLVNGIEPDVGGAEVKVEAGDIVWWDYRSWSDGAPHPSSAVGAFPRPFHRGWKGAVRPVEVAAPRELAEAAARLEAFLGANAPDDPGDEPHRFVLEAVAGQTGAELSATMGSKNGSPVTFRLAGAEQAVRAAVEALIASPEIVARHYAARFDGRGQVVDG